MPIFGQNTSHHQNELCHSDTTKKEGTQNLGFVPIAEGQLLLRILGAAFLTASNRSAAELGQPCGDKFFTSEGEKIVGKLFSPQNWLPEAPRSLARAWLPGATAEAPPGNIRKPGNHFFFHLPNALTTL